MANSYDFLAVPKPDHHVSRLVVLIIILGIILAVGWIWSFMRSPSRTIATEPEVQLTAEQVRERQRAEIISQINSLPPDRVSEEASSAIMEEIKNAKSDVSEEQKREIMLQLQTEF